MNEFVAIAAVMVAISLIVVLPPLLRGRAAGRVDRVRTNLAILKDQLAELERDRAAGQLAEDRYAEIRAELERRAIEETTTDAAAPAAAASARRGAPRWAAALAVALLLPVVAGFGYWRFGDAGAFNPLIAQSPAGGDDAHGLTPERIAGMIGSLEERLKREPDNVNGWATLARTYYSQRRFAEATRAYAKLAELVPDNADILADYADALAMERGRRIAGEPLALVNKALALDPTQWKALAMAGTEAFDRKDYPGAVAYWEKLRASLPAEAPIAQQIGASIAEARQLGGMPPAPLAQGEAKAALPRDHPPIAAAPSGGPGSVAGKAAPSPGTAAAGKAAPGAAAAGASTVGGTVALGADLKGKVAPGDRVFIFARPAQGSRMPLALTSLQVKDLPARFNLDDSMAMAPGMTLSSVAEVIVGARVSRSGQPMPQAGDLEGLSQPVKPGARDVTIVIDRVVP